MFPNPYTEEKSQEVDWILKDRIQSFCGRNTFKLLWAIKGDDWITQANLTGAGDGVSSGRDRVG